MKIYNQPNWSENQQALFAVEVPNQVQELTTGQLLTYLKDKYKTAAKEAIEDRVNWKNPSQFVGDMLEIVEPNNDPEAIAEAILNSNQLLSLLMEKDNLGSDNQSSQEELKNCLNPGLDTIIRLLREYSPEI